MATPKRCTHRRGEIGVVIMLADPAILENFLMISVFFLLFPSTIDVVSCEYTIELSFNYLVTSTEV